jgi:hypothetical protein
MAEQEKAWRVQYRANRYLEHEPILKVLDHAMDITKNACSIDRSGKYSLRSDGRWVEMFAHVSEEFRFRKIVLPAPDLPRYVRTSRAAELWDKLNLPFGSYLLKFGRKQHISDMIEKGVFRIAPAESYDDPSLNPAIADRECEFIEESVGDSVQFPPNRDYSLPCEQWISAPILGTLKQVRTYTGRAYIACFGMQYEYRLFEDFGYDACAVIRDPNRFLRAFQAAGEKLFPGWQFAYGPVVYRDPFHPIKEDDILYSKHFRYAYQCEFRVTWEHDPSLVGPLSPVFLEFGSQSDYCDFLAL